MNWYFCSQCQKPVTEDEIVKIPGAMHKACRSGRVVPLHPDDPRTP